jgi:hypothetical protein
MSKLDGIEAKLNRAEKHLYIARRAIRCFVRKRCSVVPKFNAETNRHEFIAILPDPPGDLSLPLGDAIHNLRSVLDHIVYALVLANPNRPLGTPNDATMFPICDTLEGYRRQVDKRGRLRGVLPDAVTVIDRAQPYHRRNAAGRHRRHPLWVLNALENIDKHRRLALIGNVGLDGTTVMRIDGSVASVSRVGHGFRNGAVLASYPAPEAGREVNVHHEMAVGIVFDEPSVFDGDFQAPQVIDQIIDYIRRAVIPNIARFLS